MHYHLEIIMPPTDDIEAAVKEILAPFDENLDHADENRNGYPFWNYWKIGGRWSAAKLIHSLGQKRIDAFQEGLSERHVTASGVQFGKPTLSPADQIELVDRLWQEAFPESGLRQCPLFDHYKGQETDIMRLGSVAHDLECSHLIVAGPGWQEGTLAACTMLQQRTWNGVTSQETTWDGTLGAALATHAEKCAHYREEWRAKHEPQPEWLVVTVDYHS